MHTREASMCPAFTSAVDAVFHIRLHHAIAPATAAGVEPVVAVPGRPAEVGLQHRVAARGEETRPPVEREVIARVGSAVYQQHERQFARLDSHRQREIGGDLGAVACTVLDRATLAQMLGRGELRIALADHAQLLGGRVVDVVRAGVAGLFAEQQHARAISRPGLQRHVSALEPRLHGRGDLRELGIEKLLLRQILGPAHAHDAMAPRIADRPDIAAWRSLQTFHRR